LKLNKKITELIIWVLIATYLVVVLGFVADKEDEVSCKNIAVQIVDKTSNRFVESSDIINLFKSHEKKILGYPFDSINTDDLEKLAINTQIINSVIFLFSFNVIFI